MTGIEVHVVKDKKPIYIKARGSQLVLFLDIELQDDPLEGTPLCKREAGIAVIRVPFCMSRVNRDKKEADKHPHTLIEIFDRASNPEDFVPDLVRLGVLKEADEQEELIVEENSFCFANIFGSVHFIVSGVMGETMNHLCTVVHLLHASSSGSDERGFSEAASFVPLLEALILERARAVNMKGKSLKDSITMADKLRSQWSVEVSRGVGVEFVGSLKGKV